MPDDPGIKIEAPKARGAKIGRTVDFARKQGVQLTPVQQRIFLFRDTAEKIVDAVRNGRMNPTQGRERLKAIAAEITKNDRSFRAVAGSTGIIKDIQNQADLDLLGEQARMDSDFQAKRRVDVTQKRSARTEKRLRVVRETMLQPLQTHALTTTGFGSSPLESDSVIGTLVGQIEGAKTEAEILKHGAKLSVKAPQVAAASKRAASLKRVGLGGAAASIAIPLAMNAFRGKQDIDPAIQMQLAQAMGGGQGQGVNTSRTLIDMGRLLTLIKGIQDMTGAGQGTAQAGGRLI